jgi:hypothetical protein
MPNTSRVPFTGLLETIRKTCLSGNPPSVRCLCPFQYVPRGYRVANADEITARRIGQELKIPTENAIQVAAPAMAALIVGPCWLIPVPASNTSHSANLILARAIAEFVTTARVICAVARIHPVESAYRPKLRGLAGLTVGEHALVRVEGPLEPLPAYFVDNVITTGTTVTACRRALGWGVGLAYADASTCYNSSLHRRG